MLRELLPCVLVAFSHAQFQFEIPAEMMGGFGGFGGGHPGMRQEPEFDFDSVRGFPNEVETSFNWLKGTEWTFQRGNKNMRNVKFQKDGRFEARTNECMRGRCRWAATEDKIYIVWGDEGMDTIAAPSSKAERGSKMEGKSSRGKKCKGQYVKTFDKVEDDIDLYQALGLTDEATDKEIKRAYRKLSIKYHPDKNPGNAEAQVKFNQVRDAYEVLSNEDKKIMYDDGGMQAVKDMEKEEAGGGGGQDPFSMMFGGGGGGRGRNSKKGQDAQMEFGVSLEDMYSGGTKLAHYSRRVVCKGCKNKKKQGKCAECDKCPAETRMVQRQQGNMIFQQQERVVSKHRCKEEQAELSIEVEQGMDTGAKLTFPRKGEQTPGQIPGDIILIVKQEPHPTFKRRGKNLYMDMDITLKEALLGFKKTINHLDGHEVVITQEAISKPNEVLKIKEEGMPVHNFPSQHGDLHVKLKLQMPRTLTDAAKTAIQDNLPAQ